MSSPERRKPISVGLSDAQVDHVLREATSDGGLRGLLFGETHRLKGTFAELLQDPEFDRGLSRSVMRAFAILSGFYPPGTERMLTKLGLEIGMKPSTVHRYARTLVLLGLLEKDPETQLYRLATHGL